jgi:predicted DNA-binding transcriptional regulator AlpA
MSAAAVRAAVLEALAGPDGIVPPTLDTATAAEMFGVGKDHLYNLVRSGEAPIEPLRLGRTIRWPTARVLDLLGLDTEDPS